MDQRNDDIEKNGKNFRHENNESSDGKERIEFFPQSLDIKNRMKPENETEKNIHGAAQQMDRLKNEKTTSEKENPEIQNNIKVECSQDTEDTCRYQFGDKIGVEKDRKKKNYFFELSDDEFDV